ncbi:hypothetical protein PSHI_02910 [Pseudomonas sp. URMO17WK12:I11]|nr:hypothetical protein PSHI_02910 [Pseudomonas sp. URMO17WK12:I11]
MVMGALQSIALMAPGIATTDNRHLRFVPRCSS